MMIREYKIVAVSPIIYLHLITFKPDLTLFPNRLKTAVFRFHLKIDAISVTDTEKSQFV